MTVGYSKRPRLDKLGVKPGMRVSILGVADPAFRRELAIRTREVSAGRARKQSALVFYGVDDAKRLARLAALRDSIARDGAIWVVWPKGRKHISESMIRDAALAAGLVDIKVVAFSETLSGLKLVIPVAQR